MTPEQKAEAAKVRSNFHLYQDKGVQFKLDLEAAGFQGIKIWEQPMNVMYRSGEEFMKYFATSKL